MSRAENGDAFFSNFGADRSFTFLSQLEEVFRPAFSCSTWQNRRQTYGFVPSPHHQTVSDRQYYIDGQSCGRSIQMCFEVDCKILPASQNVPERLVQKGFLSLRLLTYMLSKKLGTEKESATLVVTCGHKTQPSLCPHCKSLCHRSHLPLLVWKKN